MCLRLRTGLGIGTQHPGALSGDAGSLHSSAYHDSARNSGALS